MAKVICSLPNASEMINGVAFVSHKLGMISEEIADDVAANFAKIKGYVVADRRGKPVEPATEPGAAGAADANAGGTAPPAGDQGAAGAADAAAKTE